MTFISWQDAAPLRRRIVFLMAFFGVFAGVGTRPAAAQETPPVPAVATERPKIGVVFSGGAAFGFAHLGVLRWMEKNRVPIDYISGTSMGSLVGGFYATGMSVPEIEGLLGTVDWDELLRSTTPPRLRDFRRREDYRVFQNDLEFGRGFASATGLNPAHNIGLLLSRATLPYPDTLNFDELPIPFRCVAADLDNARAVTFASGSLALAMRSSMTIPFVFTTVYEDGKTLVDGGIFDNLPVSVMLPGDDRPKGWNPSVVVTVRLTDNTQPGSETGAVKTPSEVATAPVKTDRPANPADVVNRLINAITGENARRSLQRLKEASDIASVPLVADVTGFAVDSFADWRELAKQGEAAAEKNKAALLKYQLSEADWAEYVKAKEAKRRRSFTPQQLLFTEQDPKVSLPYNLRASLRRRLSSFIGKPLTAPVPVSAVVDALESRINELYGIGLFESLSYGQTVGAENRPALAIRAQPKSYGPPFILVGAQLSSGDSATPQSVFHLRYNGTGGGLEAAEELRGDIIVGSRTLLGVEYYRPLRLTRAFVAPAAYFRREERDLTVDKRDGADYTISEGGVQLDGGYTLGKSAEARLGLRIGSRSYSVPKDSRNGSSAKGDLFGVTARWAMDTQDDPATPRSGVFATITAANFFRAPQTSGYAQSEETISYAAALTRRITLQATLRAGQSLSGDAPPPEQFLLGGPYHLSSLAQGELRGESYEYGSFGVRYRLTPQSSILGGALNVGLYLETVAARRTDGSTGKYAALHAAAVLPTRLGPVAAGIGIGNAGRRRFYVSLGRLF